MVTTTRLLDSEIVPASIADVTVSGNQGAGNVQRVKHFPHRARVGHTTVVDQPDVNI